MPLSEMPVPPLDVAASYFNCFHDGFISHAAFGDSGDLQLRIDIQYLAQRLAPDMRCFILKLTGVRFTKIDPWADANEEPIAISAQELLSQGCEILSAEVESSGLKLFLNQPNSDAGYSGATVMLDLSGAACHDELGVAHSATEIETLARGYWEEWEAKHGRDAV